MRYSLVTLAAFTTAVPALAQLPASSENASGVAGFSVGARHGDRIGDRVGQRDDRVTTPPARLNPGANPSKPAVANATGYVELPSGVSVYSPGSDASGH